MYYLLADYAETLTTAVAFGCFRPGECSLDVNRVTGALIHVLADVKWILLAANLVAIVTLFVAGRKRARPALRLRGSPVATAPGPPGGVIAVVGIFVILVAAPLGGGLDQMPDVLRVEMDQIRDLILGGDWSGTWRPLVSGVALAAFAALVYACVAASVRPVAPTPVNTGHVFSAMATISVLLLIAYVILEPSPGLVAALPVAAPMAVWAAVWVLKPRIYRLGSRHGRHHLRASRRRRERCGSAAGH